MVVAVDNEIMDAAGKYVMGAYCYKEKGLSLRDLKRTLMMIIFQRSFEVVHIGRYDNINMFRFEEMYVEGKRFHGAL